jgi:hypothetical protein
MFGIMLMVTLATQVLGYYRVAPWHQIAGHWLKYLAYVVPYIVINSFLNQT